MRKLSVLNFTNVTIRNGIGLVTEVKAIAVVVDSVIEKSQFHDVSACQPRLATVITIIINEIRILATTEVSI